MGNLVNFLRTWVVPKLVEASNIFNQKQAGLPFEKNVPPLLQKCTLIILLKILSLPINAPQ